MPNFRAYTDQFGQPANPGTFRHQITYQRRTVTGQNSFGDDTATWANHATIYASVRALVGRELAAVTQIWAEARYKIEHHYYPGITPQDRISWYMDGVVKLLDVLDAGDAAGRGAVQVIYAKDHVE
jgi:head-tail adaptor